MNASAPPFHGNRPYAQFGIASIGCLMFMLGATRTLAATRIALLTTGSAQTTAQIIELTTAKLGPDAKDIELVDREAINAIIQEQKLSVSGLVDREKMIQVGKLVKADLFAVVDTDASGGQTLGLVIFDSATGLRMWDAAIAGNPEQAADSIAAAIRDAVTKDRKLNHGTRLVGFLPVRNANLPRERDLFCDTVRLLLERQILASPDVAVLERSRLDQVNRERRLPTAGGQDDLWPSVVLVQLEISRPPDGHGLHASAIVTDGAGQQLHKLDAGIDGDAAPDLADKLKSRLMASLKIPAIDRPFDRGEEARRFARDSQVLVHNGRYAAAAAAAEAAYALQPDDANRMILTTSLWASAFYILTPDSVDLVEVLLAGFGPIHLSPEDLERTLALASRALEMQRQSLKEETAGQHQGQSFMEYTGDEKRITFLWAFCGRLNAVEDVTPAFQPLITEFRSAAMDYLLIYHDGWGDGVAGCPSDLINYNGGIFYAVETAASIAPSFADFTAARDHLIHHWIKVLDQSWSRSADLWLEGGLRQSQLMGTLLHKSSVAQRRWNDFSEEAFRAYLRPVAEELNHSSYSVMQMYGSIATVLADPHSAAMTPEAADRHVNAFMHQFEQTMEQPGSEARSTRLCAYVAAVDGIRLLPAGTKSTAELAIDLLNRGARHKQLIPYPALRLLFPVLKRDERPRESMAALEKTLDLSRASDCQILDDNAGGVRQMLANEIHGVHQRHPELGPEKAAQPWDSATRLADAGDLPGISTLEQCPRVAGEALCFIGSGDQEGKTFIQAFEVNLKGGQPRALARVTLPNEQSSGIGYDGFGDLLIQGGAVDERNYAVSVHGRGVVVFPRDGGNAFRIDNTNGLPSNWARALAWAGGSLYISSSANEGAYLTKWNPKGKSLQVCVSSLRKDRKSPLDDTPGLRIVFMIEDAPRKRLLLSVGQYSRNQRELWDNVRGGLWQLDPNNGEMKQLLTVAPGLDLGPYRGIDQGFFYEATTLWVVEYDLAHDRGRYLSYKPGSITDSYIRQFGFEKETMKGAGWSEPDAANYGTRRVIDHWLWIGQPFSRLSADAKTVELLDARLAPENEPMGPVSTMELAADHRLILGDSRQLYVVKLR